MHPYKFHGTYMGLQCKKIKIDLQMSYKPVIDRRFFLVF